MKSIKHPALAPVKAFAWRICTAFPKYMVLKVDVECCQSDIHWQHFIVRMSRSETLDNESVIVE